LIHGSDSFVFFVPNTNAVYKPGAAQKLSIVHVIDRLHTGGAERVLVTLANIFFSKGHPIKVVTLTEKGPLAAQLLPGIEQVNLGRTFKYSPITMQKLIAAVKGFDVVHVHSFYNLRYLWLAKMIFGLRKPVFYHEHLGFRANMQATAWQKYILPKNIFIATTKQINEWAVTEAGMKPNRVFTLPNIVLKQETGTEQSGEATVNNHHMVLVSNIRVEKNIEFGITLLQYLHRGENKNHLTIIGKLSDMPYYERLQQLAREAGMDKYITWVHNADSVQQLLPNFAVGLHTSPSESGPLAVIEYLAQGLPFVAYDTGEVINTIKPELPGCIVDTFDPIEWENKIHALQAKPATALKQQLQTVFEKYFSAEAYYEQCMGIYNAR